MGKVYQIAKNTFREAIRDKILYVIAFFAVVLMLSSVGLGWISVGDQMQVVAHFSLAAISFFGALIAVFVGTGLIYKEIDKRTIYTILSKPVFRWQFLLGKFFGLMAVLALAIAGMTVAAAAFVAYAGYATESSGLNQLVDRIRWDWFFIAAGMTFFEVMVTVSLALLFGTVTSPILSAVFTFTAYMVGQVSSVINYMFTEFTPMTESVAARTGEHLTDIVSSGYWFIGPFSKFLYYVLPDLQHFQFRNQVVMGPAVTASQAGLAVLYGIGYSAAVLFLTMLIFDRKRF